MAHSTAEHHALEVVERQQVFGPRRDGTDYLTLWIVLLFGIPASQVIEPLGAIGTPALLVAAGAAVLWVASFVLPSLMDVARGVQPLRVAVLGWMWYQVATIVMAQTRTLTPLEQSASVREAFVLFAMGGVALLVMDGIPSIERLTTLLRRVVWGSGFMATVGLLQFATGAPIVFGVPGLSTERMRLGLAERSIFDRPYGTSMHPIEFSVVLGALLPLALYFALESERGSTRQRVAVAACIAIALGIPLSISRSGILSVVASMGVAMLAWSWRRRAQAAVVGVMALPVLWIMVPGLVGTFRNMLTGLSDDPSIQARLDDLPLIMDVIRQRPWFGLGAGTFSVDDYFLVDNQFWVSTMETGIVGITLTFALFLLAVMMAVTSRHHRLATASTSHLGYAIAGGIVGLVVSMFTFDAFFYHVVHGMLFLLLGASGALWRLTREGDLES